jgi:hypothetical protein
LVGEPDRPFDAKPTLRTRIAGRYAESAEPPLRAAIAANK